jgi:hypothetical protein
MTTESKTQIAQQIADDLNSYIGSQWGGRQLSYDLETAEAAGSLGRSEPMAPETGRVVLTVPRPWGGPVAARDARPITAAQVLTAAQEQALDIAERADHAERERTGAIERIAKAEADLTGARPGTREHAHALDRLDSARDALARARG